MICDARAMIAAKKKRVPSKENGTSSNKKDIELFFGCYVS